MRALREAADCDGLVLCGGRGLRVGGADKGVLAVHGEPAVCRAIAVLQPQCRRVLISANRHLDHYRALARCRLLPDLRPGFPGPLAAFEALAGADPAPLVLALPCDLALVSPEVPARLLDALRRDAQCDAVYARSADEHQYLCVALRRRSLRVAVEHLDRGQRSVRGWLAAVSGRDLDVGPDLGRGLENFNTAAHWEQLR